MTKSILVATLFVGLSLFFLNTAIGQNNNLQLDFGVSGTLHYDAPLTFVWCIEGCVAEMQHPRPALNLDLSYYRKITSKSALKIGFGYHQIRVHEKLRGGLGGFYDRRLKMNMANFSLGYRYSLNKKERIEPYIENDFSIDYTLSSENFEVAILGLILNEINFAYKLGVGFLLNLSPGLRLNVQGNFKTAIIRYNSERHKDAFGEYLPYGLGLSLGLNKQF